VVTFRQLKIANMDAESATVDPVQSLDQLFPQLDEFRQQKGLPPAPEKLEGVDTTLDQWDGFQAERRRVTQRFRDDATFSGTPGVENLVTISGDIHSYLAGYIKANYDNSTCQLDNGPVGVELVCGSITSANLSEIAIFDLQLRAAARRGSVHRAGDRQQPPHQVLQLQRARLQHRGGHEGLDPLRH
jgi:phosphodiesterase/alkaline phosphatase D-like protein